MSLFVNSLISSKHHLGTFVGADVLKGPGLYHPQESCFVRLPRVADFFCELHGLLLVVGLTVLPADVKSN